MTDAIAAHSSASESESVDTSCLTGTNGGACLDDLSLFLAFVAAAAHFSCLCARGFGSCPFSLPAAALWRCLVEGAGSSGISLLSSRSLRKPPTSDLTSLSDLRMRSNMDVSPASVSLASCLRLPREDLSYPMSAGRDFGSFRHCSGGACETEASIAAWREVSSGGSSCGGKIFPSRVSKRFKSMSLPSSISLFI